MYIYIIVYNRPAFADVQLQVPYQPYPNSTPFPPLLPVASPRHSMCQHRFPLLITSSDATSDCVAKCLLMNTYE